MFLEGRGNPFPQTPLPQRALLERKFHSHKKRSDECPADPPSGSSHPSTEGLQQEPLRFHFSYQSDSFALPAGGPATGHGHHATPAAIHPDKMHLGRGGARGRGGPFRMGAKGPPLPRKNAACSSPVPACPLDKSRERMVKNSFPHPVPARRLSRVPE